MPANLDDLRRLREEALAAGPRSGKWINCAQALMDQFPAYYATAKAMNERQAELFAALQTCMDAMLRMIPDYCAENAAEPCTDVEHDHALAAAGRALYGHNSVDWPAGLRKAAGGKYA